MRRNNVNCGVILHMLGFAAVASLLLATLGGASLAQTTEESREQARKAAQQQAAQISKIIRQQIDDLSKQTKVLQDQLGAMRNEVRRQCGLSPENVMPTLLRLERDRFQV